MDLTPEVVVLGTQLAEAAARNGAALVTDKVKSLLASGKKDDTIAGLEQLVSELVSDKAEITRIAQAYQAELVAQRLSAGDVKYIADTVVPLLERMVSSAGGDEAAIRLQQIEAIKPLLSVETANVLQMIGFNFRRAIGEPLTERVGQMITGQADRTTELQIENLKNQQQLAKLAADPEAYERFIKFFRG